MGNKPSSRFRVLSRRLSKRKKAQRQEESDIEVTEEAHQEAGPDIEVTGEAHQEEGPPRDPALIFDQPIYVNAAVAEAQGNAQSTRDCGDAAEENENRERGGGGEEEEEEEARDAESGTETDPYEDYDYGYQPGRVLCEETTPKLRERDKPRVVSYCMLGSKVRRRQEASTYLSVGPGERKLACFVFATCHRLHAGSFLKITMVLANYDSAEQQQEQIIREKVGRMEFGKQVHEDCHYLCATHKEDVGVKVSGLRGGWKTGANGDDNPVVQVVRYRKLWGGNICFASFHFETLADCQPELFGANFKIQQDGLAEEATIFDICEPISKFTTKTENNSKPYRHGNAHDMSDVKSVATECTVTSCADSSDQSLDDLNH